MVTHVHIFDQLYELKNTYKVALVRIYILENKNCAIYYLPIVWK